jgi:hypothetical protein
MSYGSWLNRKRVIGNKPQKPRRKSDATISGC